MKLVLKTFLPAAGISILAALPCVAQVAIAPSKGASTPSQNSRKLHVIALRFVRPSVIAWWIDPKHHAAPREFGPDDASTAQPVKPFALPEGVERLVAIDPQNTLLVLGTAAGAQEVRDRVAFLDRPQRRVTLEARLITVQSDKLSGFWADLAARTTPETPTIAPLTTRDEQLLSEQFLSLQARIESVRSLTVAMGATQNLDFSPPASTGRKPLWMRDFSSAMPVIPPPKTGDMNVLGRGGTVPVSPAPIVPFTALFEQIRLQISPTPGENNLISLKMLFPERSGAPGHSTELNASLRAGESLALALPATASGSRAFLLLAARLTPVLQALETPTLPSEASSGQPSSE